MSSKMDRQGARTPADLESKYKFGKAFSEVTKTANEAKKAAENLDSDEIFNRLTDGGQVQGIYKVGNQIFINADLIKAGHIRSVDNESVVIDLEEGTAKLTGSLKTEAATNADGDEVSAEMSAGTITVIAYNRTVTLDILGVNVVYDDGVTKYRAELSAHQGGAFIALAGQGDALSLDVSNGDKRIYLNGGEIKGVNAPTADTDAANKAYVDAQIAALKAQLS